MAEEKKQKTPEEIAKEREDKEKDQLAMLTSGSLKDLFVAAVNNVEESPINLDFGKEGKHATYDFKYLTSLEAQTKKPDTNYARIMAQAALNAERSSGERMAASYSARNLFETAISFYMSGIDSIRVKNLLGTMDVKKYDDIQGIADMYMGDLKKANKDLYGAITSAYLGSLVEIGTGEAIVSAGKGRRKNLEGMLNAETRKKEEAAKEAEKAKEKK